MGLSQAAGDQEPAERVFAGEGSLFSILRADFKAHGLEGFDFPAIGKGIAVALMPPSLTSFPLRKPSLV
jgi:hypothetical protein